MCCLKLAPTDASHLPTCLARNPTPIKTTRRFESASAVPALVGYLLSAIERFLHFPTRSVLPTHVAVDLRHVRALHQHHIPLEFFSDSGELGEMTG